MLQCGNGYRGLSRRNGEWSAKMSRTPEFSWPIGMPLVRSLGRELWEVRSSLPRGQIARVLFCVERGGMVLLHGFLKKTQKTPQHEIDLALKPKKAVGHETKEHRIIL